MEDELYLARGTLITVKLSLFDDENLNANCHIWNLKLKEHGSKNKNNTRMIATEIIMCVCLSSLAL